jgi:hypothetical protein
MTSPFPQRYIYAHYIVATQALLYSNYSTVSNSNAHHYSTSVGLTHVVNRRMHQPAWPGVGLTAQLKRQYRCP